VEAGQACFKNGAVIGKLVGAKKGKKMTWAVRKR
jgi:hypothetical protein